MPGKVKVRIVAGRNLPVMDRASDTCDAFVEMKLCNTTYKTEVFKHSLNPEWNSEWFRFEIDDEELQDEPLQLRVMDYDTYSANDAIGKVYINLNPLLCKESGSLMCGWFPIYDTMHGIRGEINVMVRVHLFSDSNKYRESSCGVQFFYSGAIPEGHNAQAILGFVEELVVNDDPEYQWIDKIRTPRASNEARQTLFSKLSGEVQRKIGLKALELGGNAVLGYHQCFDLEGESGIVIRGIGTAVILTRFSENEISTASPKDVLRESPLLEEQIPSSDTGASSPTGVQCKSCHSPAKGTLTSAHRRSSDSDLSTPPKVGSIGENSGSKMRSVQRPAVAQDSLSILEYPFITMRIFPEGFIQHVGGVVSARSVKLLVQINNPDEPETRDAWWTELRKEIRSHIRALGCNVVLGYMESTNISDDICVLSASGTAAVLTPSNLDTSNTSSAPILGMSFQPRPSLITTAATSERREPDHEKEKEIVKEKEKPLKIDINLANQVKQTHISEGLEEILKPLGCGICHIPYSESSVPFPANLVRCNVCRKGKVPDVLFMTIEPPENLPLNGKSCLLQARVSKIKKDGKGEQNAKEISDILPFLEYELHRQLLNKLKVKCMNAIFGLKVQVSIGDKLIIGIATGTGVYISSLPPPNLPKIACGKSVNDSKMTDIQKQILDAFSKNKEYFGIKSINYTSQDSHSDSLSGLRTDDADSSGDDDLPDLDFSAGNKDACILEVDDAEDVDIISQLVDPKVPSGFDLCNTETLPGMDTFTCNLQMFTRIYRTKFSGGPNNAQVSKIFDSVIKSLFVKLRRLVPCCLTNLSFQVDLVDQDEVQVTVLGIAIGLGEITSSITVHSPTSKQHSTSTDSEMMFTMDDEKTTEPPHSSTHRRRASLHASERSYCYQMSLGEHNGVDMTPLSYIPGKKIEQYLGDLDFFFIRESSSIRESGGLNGFLQSFIAETLAIVRAHVSALGGNAVIAFHITQCILLHNPHKNQGQCLVNVAGDAVLVQVPQNQSLEIAERKVAQAEAQDTYGP